MQLRKADRIVAWAAVAFIAAIPLALLVERLVNGDRPTFGFG